MAAATAKPIQASGSHAFDVEDVEYLRHGDKPLLARLFKPKGAGPFPMMIDLHGGAWCNGDRLNDTPLNEALAQNGILVAALDFRMPPQAAYPASMADINYGVRWLKSQASALKGRPGRVGVIGISSGGHQGMLAAMRPNDPRYVALPISGGANIDARIACVVMCWPVIDPLGRYRYAQRLTASGGKYPEALDRVLPLHIKYWGNEAAMDEGNPVGALERGENAELPPVLYVQGAADLVHPAADRERFIANYRKRGGEVDLALYEGEVEGFVVRNAGSPAAAQAKERIIAFVHKHLG
jgi:acetyl esterase/lipase